MDLEELKREMCVLKDRKSSHMEVRGRLEYSLEENKRQNADKRWGRAGDGRGERGLMYCMYSHFSSICFILCLTPTPQAVCVLPGPEDFRAAAHHSPPAVCSLRPIEGLRRVDAASDPSHQPS